MGYQFGHIEAPQLAKGAKPKKVFIVEDDRSSLLFIEQQLEALGYETASASDGETACEMLERSPEIADVIVLDRTLPGIDGIDVSKRLQGNEKLNAKPIVMVTGCDTPEQIKEGMDSGVFYYLIKPLDISVLQSVLNAAMRRAEENYALLRTFNDQNVGISCLQSAKFQFKTIPEARSIAAILSQCFKNPNQVLVGISELLMNAVEHGNLEIGHEKKSELLHEGLLETEIEQRLQQDEYKDRFVEASLSKRDEGTYVIVTDMGPGFDPKRFMSIDPAKSGAKNGRGIAQARIVSFDKLGYNEKGNRAIGFVSNASEIEW